MSWPHGIDNATLHRAVDVHAIGLLETGGLEALDAWQAHHWRLLQDWLHAHTPWWRERLGSHTDWALPQGWPILLREELQAMVARHGAAPVPPHHGSLRQGHTSGSTGQPVAYFASQFAQRVINHTYFCDHRRQGRNPFSLMAVVDARTPRHDGEHIAHAASIEEGVGPLLRRNAEQFPPAAHLDWLAAQRPRYLTTTPTWLAAIVEAAGQGARTVPALEQVMTYGATVDPDLRARVRALTGASIRDRYSCDECGPLAFQCPQSDGHYHVAVSNVRLEVVDAEGRACAAGVPGRVLVTGLHQYATPVVRYDIGDVAALHRGCPGCGAATYALSQLLGRRRFLIRLPDGRLVLALVMAGEWLTCAPVQEHRLVQTAPNQVRAEIVMHRAITPAESEAIGRMLARVLSQQLHYEVVQVPEIPKTASKKRQDVISLIP